MHKSKASVKADPVKGAFLMEGKVPVWKEMIGAGHLKRNKSLLEQVIGAVVAKNMMQNEGNSGYLVKTGLTGDNIRYFTSI